MTDKGDLIIDPSLVCEPLRPEHLDVLAAPASECRSHKNGRCRKFGCTCYPEKFGWECDHFLWVKGKQRPMPPEGAS